MLFTEITRDYKFSEIAYESFESIVENNRIFKVLLRSFLGNNRILPKVCEIGRE